MNPALGADDPRHGVVDEGVEVFDAQGLELLFVFGVVDLLEDILEVWSYCLEMVSFVANHRSCLVSMAYWKQDRAKELMDLSVLNCACSTPGPSNLFTVCQWAVRRRSVAGKHQLGLAGAGHAVLGRAVDVAKGVARDGDGFFPGAHHRRDTLDHDGRAEHRAVQNGADGAVGALPHLGKVVFLHALALGVMVAHLTATPYFLLALAASIVTWSCVSSRWARPRS